ncbi:BadF/BadG/BcrA/BcrD ATPase family protein [Aeromicrobium ginsengisoli]|uniref:ATPase BadF/BadG/BcrA/BcrD type domain-containing protein n=1 Tax=Aeromicrobium ginsengisoli TaxID=363867 RepID=A0A5M4FEM3_9ACTN|nr:BadF/BadG/BcrA/BcrD ATPase family protein [Aeromicrobium ginsengisoli]KAA1397669.1 hypothetical protein ESP70_009955 [Aeromicrobium ginsengisoli]
MTSWIAGVDVGGGGIRVQVRTDDVGLKARDRGPVPRIAGAIDTSRLCGRIGELINSVVESGARPAFERIAVGLTGMPGLVRPAELADQLRLHVKTSSVVVASDSVTTHLGALGGEAGCVVSAGTGAIALGTDHRSTWNRADGWGYLLGDEGGGGWIGTQGIRAALRFHDRRDGGSEALLRKVEHQFGGVSAALAAIYNSPSPIHSAATLAPLVADAAHEDDPVARAIWVEAGRLLAESAFAAARGLPQTYSWGGRLFDAGELLLGPFRDEVLKRSPDAEIRPPQGQAADGALLLAARGIPAGAIAEPYVHEFA